MKQQTIMTTLYTGILVLSVWIVWFLYREWTTGVSPLFEGFQTAPTPSPPSTLQKMMMVLIGPGSGPSATEGDIFLSQIGTSFTSPSWQKYASTTMSSISGAEGRLFATNSSTYAYATATNTKLSDGQWTRTNGSDLKQVSRDDRRVCSVSISGVIWCKMENIEFPVEVAQQTDWINLGSDARWVSVSNGRIAVIHESTQAVSYSPSYTSGSITWRMIQSNLGKRLMKQVVLDDQRIGALDMEGNIFMADLAEGGGLAANGSLTKDPRWFQLAGKRARYLEMRFGHVLIIDEVDGKIYYSDDYRYGDRWAVVPMPSTMKQVFRVSGATPSSYTKAQATAACTTQGAELASSAQLTAAWKAGANWCAYAWTSDGGRQLPNNEDTSTQCGGPNPGVKGGGDTDMNTLGDATCFGAKPVEGTATISPFNSKFWNAPPLAIEFVPFSSTPPFCAQRGIQGIYKGQRFRYYKSEECEAISAELTDGRTTTYNAGNGDCRISGTYVPYTYTAAERAQVSANSAVERTVCESVSGRVFTQGDDALAPGCGTQASCCAPADPTKPAPDSMTKLCNNIQDQPTRSLDHLWNDGSSGLCIFNPKEYKTKYSLQENDIGLLYRHWLDVGLTSNYSPCGDINPFCHWDPDAYYEINPSARTEQPLNALQHYKEKGIRAGLTFCKPVGSYSLTDKLKMMMQGKPVVSAPLTITSKCTSEVVATGTPNFEYKEVFMVNTPVSKTQAVATCAAAAPGAKVATVAQLRDAQLNMANWCTGGWVAASSTGSTQTIEGKPYFVQAVTGGCVVSTAAGVYQEAGVVPATAPVNCFGVKPLTSSVNPAVRTFNARTWSQYSKVTQAFTTRRWTCETRDAANLLFKGPSSAEEAYLSKDDSVCYLQDKDEKTYACQTAQEYANGEDYTVELMDAHSLNCDNIKNTLADISGSLTVIANIKQNLESGRTSFSNSAATFEKVKTKYNCGNPAKTQELTNMCNTIDAAKQNMLTYADSIQRTGTTLPQGVLDVFLAPIASAEASRDKLVTMKNNLGCPS
jgi:hypothetical protein